MKEGTSLHQFLHKVYLLHMKIDPNVDWKEIVNSVRDKATPKYKAMLTLQSFASYEDFKQFVKRVDRANEHLSEAQREQIMTIQMDAEKADRKLDAEIQDSKWTSKLHEAINQINTAAVSFNRGGNSNRGRGGYRGGQNNNSRGQNYGRGQ